MVFVYCDSIEYVKSRGGGGVLIAIKEFLKTKEINFQNSCVEHLFIEVNFNSVNCVLSATWFNPRYL